jgi:hypothetical protein
MFCHEGPGKLVDSRIWLMGHGRKRRAFPALAGENEYFTHEYWYADGSALGYVGYSRDENNKTTKTLDCEDRLTPGRKPSSCPARTIRTVFQTSKTA